MEWAVVQSRISHAARAAGNVQDRSNTGLRTLSYGLPVASEIYGFNWNMPDWHGLSAQEKWPSTPSAALPQSQPEAPPSDGRNGSSSYGQFAYRRFLCARELFSGR